MDGWMDGKIDEHNTYFIINVLHHFFSLSVSQGSSQGLTALNSQSFLKEPI